MRDVALSVVGIVVGLLAMIVYFQEVEIQGQQKLIAQLGTSVESISQATDLDLQDKCAKQAQHMFDSGGWNKDKRAFYFDHYNSSLKKCFLFIHDYIDDSTAAGALDLTEDLSDAFELTEYGYYFQAISSDPTKVAPIDCEMTLQNGQQATCHSEDEFTEFVKSYMGEDFH
jgi:hypothetical protein